VEFLPDGGHAVPAESGETMSRRARRNHTPAFKAKVALAAVKGDRTLAQLITQRRFLVSSTAGRCTEDWTGPDAGGVSLALADWFCKVARVPSASSIIRFVISKHKAIQFRLFERVNPRNPRFGTNPAP
jgi:hypothetical protein